MNDKRKTLKKFGLSTWCTKNLLVIDTTTALDYYKDSVRF